MYLNTPLVVLRNDMFYGATVKAVNLLGGCKYKVYNMTTVNFVIYNHPVN